jgi:hypothetical protein
MNQFLLQQEYSKELQPFPHIIEFALKKNNTIQLNSLNETTANSLRIYYIMEGKFEWIINRQHYILYPTTWFLCCQTMNLAAKEVCWILVLYAGSISM